MARGRASGNNPPMGRNRLGNRSGGSGSIKGPSDQTKNQGTSRVDGVTGRALFDSNQVSPSGGPGIPIGEKLKGKDTKTGRTRGGGYRTGSPLP